MTVEIDVEIEVREYSRQYSSWRRKLRRRIIERIYPVWNYDSIISKHIIEDVVFDNFLT
jgi:hypothetical protein